MGLYEQILRNLGISPEKAEKIDVNKWCELLSIVKPTEKNIIILRRKNQPVFEEIVGNIFTFRVDIGSLGPKAKEVFYKCVRERIYMIRLAGERKEIKGREGTYPKNYVLALKMAYLKASRQLEKEKKRLEGIMFLKTKADRRADAALDKILSSVMKKR